MEEIKNATDIAEEIENVNVMPEIKGGNLKKVAIGLGVGAVAVVTAWAIKNKGKLDDWRICKLEKKGYVVYKPDEVKVEDDSEEIE